MLKLLWSFLVGERAEVPGWLIILIFSALIVGGIYGVIRQPVNNFAQSLGNAISGQ